MTEDLQDDLRARHRASDLDTLHGLKRSIWLMPLVQGVVCFMQLFLVWDYLQKDALVGAIISAIIYLFCAGIACILARKYRALYAELLSKTAVAKLKGEWPYDRVAN